MISVLECFEFKFGILTQQPLKGRWHARSTKQILTRCSSVACRRIFIPLELVNSVNALISFRPQS